MLTVIHGTSAEHTSAELDLSHKKGGSGFGASLNLALSLVSLRVFPYRGAEA